MKNSSYTPMSMDLTSNQWRWLEDMTSKYKLSGTSKAMRCCINCVALGDAQMQSDGCCGCNDTITKDLELSTEQLAWIEGQKHQCDESTLSIEQKVVSACMKLDEYTVFGIIRCKSSVAKCEGAQEAVENIQQQFSMKKGEVVTKENIDICAKSCGCE
mmetsp:Transcript_14159/g.23256  ORF Transcript_14159/g.23256 Transcript_14159/m.23256 type:complete len:158 (-) Transcript_14159:135-608(-)